MNLTYRSHVGIEDLAENECTIHRCSDVTGAIWWQLWFYVHRDTDNVLEYFCVPVKPGGVYSEGPPCGKVWGLAMTVPGVWQIAPSIDVWTDEDARLYR